MIAGGLAVLFVVALVALLSSLFGRVFGPPAQGLSDDMASRAVDPILPTDLTGRNMGIISAYDRSRNVITIDVVRYLAGDDLVAYLAADRDRWAGLVCELGEGIYDHFDGTFDLSRCSPAGEPQEALNDEPRVRELSVVPDAQFTILSDHSDGSVHAVPATREEFKAAVLAPRLGNYYWVTVNAQGAVSSIEAHFFS